MSAKDYTPYTKTVKAIIAKTHEFPLMDFEMRVDGTGYMVAKCKAGKYYQQIFTYDEMKLPAASMAAKIISITQADPAIR